MPQIVHTTDGANLADILERILDKGVVIAGDIRIKLVEIELLTINIRLLIASVDKAREIGVDWWCHSPFLCSTARPEISSGRADVLQPELTEIKARLERLENAS